MYCTWAHNFQLTMWFDSLLYALIWKTKFKQFGMNFQWNWNSCRFIKFWVVIKNKFAISHTFFVVYISILKKTHWFGFNFFGRLIGLSFQWNWNSCGLIKFWVVDWKCFTLSNTMSIFLLDLIPLHTYLFGKKNMGWHCWHLYVLKVHVWIIVGDIRSFLSFYDNIHTHLIVPLTKPLLSH
jgi:hypothetical protein